MEVSSCEGRVPFHLECAKAVARTTTYKHISTILVCFLMRSDRYAGCPKWTVNTCRITPNWTIFLRTYVPATGRIDSNDQTVIEGRRVNEMS
ncbi:hypothetical protein NPIL_545871 [Nephila pilipes]|uniref:Uncharacterized protein n=1 Tax=Nephila pilipes TaxID=299642 RepID=A0A8X6MAC8_NEPPI|nr:hypothetical protein NPIL_545871 [Nephila pilipes]